MYIIRLAVPACGCRLKATLERLQRLTEAYSEELLELLPPVANALGAALGVAQHAITTFTEAEIRANVVFQVRVLGGEVACLLGMQRHLQLRAPGPSPGTWMLLMIV